MLDKKDLENIKTSLEYQFADYIKLGLKDKANDTVKTLIKIIDMLDSDN